MESSIRVIGTYEQEKFTVSSIQHIEMLSQASDPLNAFDNVVGFWMELRNKDNKPLYRQIMRDPFQPHAEVFNRNKDQSIQINMGAVDSITGHLVLLVPYSEDADHIALVRSAVDAENKQLVRTDVVRIPIQTQKQ